MSHRGWLAFRGVGAVMVAAVIAAVLIARAAGHLDRTSDIYVGIPVSAGLITSQSPVRYHGVNIGHISAIESGAEMSKVRLSIDSGALHHVPVSVVARVVPRTFFGDIYLRLIDPQGRRSTQTLAPGDSVTIDRSPDAIALYDMFTKIVALFSQIQPERMQSAMTAIGQALRGRGHEIGSTIDDLSAAADVLSPSLDRLLDTTPQFRDVMAALHDATPDVIATLRSATAISDRMVNDHAFGPALDTVTRLGVLLTGFLNDNRRQLITVLDAAGKILATTAQHPTGLTDTLAGVNTFGEAGARIFSTGKFNITAVATFAGPMPYRPEDCPHYGDLVGAHCAESGPALVPTPRPADPFKLPAADLPIAAPASDVVDPDREAPALAVLQDQLLPQQVPTVKPNIATEVILGPTVRGTEVRVP